MEDRSTTTAGSTPGTQVDRSNAAPTPLSAADRAAHLAASYVRRPAVLKPAPKAPRVSALAVAS